MTGPRVHYTPRPDATPASEVSTLAAIYALVLGKKAARPAPEPDGYDGTETKEDSACARIIPERP